MVGVMVLGLVTADWRLAIFGLGAALLWVAAVKLYVFWWADWIER